MNDGQVTSDVSAQRSFQNAVGNAKPVGKILDGQDITLSLAGPNGTKISVPGKPGDTVYDSETVTTGDRGSANIGLSDGSRLSIGPYSNVPLQGITSPPTGTLNVRSGTVAPLGNTQVRTPAVLLGGVRG